MDGAASLRRRLPRGYRSDDIGRNGHETWGSTWIPRSTVSLSDCVLLEAASPGSQTAIRNSWAVEQARAASRAKDEVRRSFVSGSRLSPDILHTQEPCSPISVIHATSACHCVKRLWAALGDSLSARGWDVQSAQSVSGVGHQSRRVAF